MQLSDAMKIRIKKLADENNLTLYSLAVESGIPTSTLNDFFVVKLVCQD